MRRKFISILSFAIACSLAFGTVSCGDDEPANPSENNQSTPGDKTDPETPGDKTDPETPGDKTDPETPGDKTDPEGPSEPVVIKYKVNINGENTEVEKDAKITLPEIAEYTFMDAELVDASGNKYTSQQEITVTGDITISTICTPKASSVSVDNLSKKLGEMGKAIRDFGIDKSTVFDITITGYVDGFMKQDKVLTAIHNYGEFPLNITIEANDDFTTLGESAFVQCPELRKLVLPEGLKNIEQRAITQNKNLKEIILPNSLESIYVQAFSDNASLESLSIGENVKTLGRLLVIDCPNLKTITILSREVKYYSWYTTSFDAYDWDAKTEIKNTSLEHIYVKADNLDWYLEKYPNYADIIEVAK